MTNHHRRWVAFTLALVGLAFAGSSKNVHAQSFAKTITGVQPKIVKIYGAGGVRGLEPYQSGMVISPEGHVLTSWSYVLDTDYITVTLNDGRKFQGELVGYDPRLEIAVLKIDAVNLSYFNLDKSVELKSGARVLAFSNIYGVAAGDEAASVLHGVVSAKSKLFARRGVFETPYRGEAYVLDAMTNNPGGAGGALTDTRGRLAGILGKELRNAQNNTWLNYAIPVAALADSVDNLKRGLSVPSVDPEDLKLQPDPLTLSMLGITLVPDVLAKTPPFIDQIRRGSAAEKSGLKTDDLILFCDDDIMSSCEVFRVQLLQIDRDDSIRLTVQRGQELIEVELSAND
ncbi:S1C family serine protease [Lignipirellula cremea]|uniref:Serine protease HhoB n=1 Tax=Lignipirellula cremea TaxID=2528010 RepID=A0A518DMS4_9BACT|nr:S1C family serine protease [Lignipirellula cremea]QDU93140.1 Putative serine protease HhoB precursor [Lignipirellula cremea]